MQTCRQRIDVCALGLLCVPQPHGDQTQPVVATPELGDGRLLCSCRSCPSLRLRGRSSFRLGHRADLPDGFQEVWSSGRPNTRHRSTRSRFSWGRPPAPREVSCRMCHRADWKAASTHPDPALPRTLRWPTTTDVKVAIESHGSSPTSAEAPRRRLAQGLAGSPVTCLPRHARRTKPRGRRETLERGLGTRVALPVCFGAGCYSSPK